MRYRPSSSRPPRAAVALSAILLISAWPGLTAVAGEPSVAALAQPHASSRIIVGFESRAGASQGWRLGSVSVASARPVSPLASDVVVVELAEGQSVGRAMGALADEPGVAYVEPDYRVQAAASPDDPHYLDGEQWSMYGQDTVPANRFGSAAGEAWALGHTGSSRVLVGVVDEGLKVSHPDLAPNTWRNPGESVNGLDDDGNGYVDDTMGWDFYHHDASVYDGTTDDHGTHVAGIIGARGGNGLGVAGVSWRVTLVPAKFLGPDGGYVSDAVAAIDYLTDLRSRHGLTIAAINASWSGGGHSQALQDAIDRAGDAGILVVAAAGNDGRDIDREPAYPAAYRCVTRADGSDRGWDCLLAVADLEPDGDLSSTSNHGLVGVDLGAPGTAVMSTHPDGEAGYASASGTSMAAPHVSGAAALCASLDPGLSARAIRARIMETLTPTGSLAGRTAGGGRLDIGALVARCSKEPELEPEPTPTPAPTPAPTPESEPEPTPTLPSDPSPVVLVDDRDPTFVREGAGWKQGWVGHAGHHYWLVTRRAAVRNRGEWRPVLERPGWYEVRVYIPTAHATTNHAVYKVATVDGWVTRVRDQERWRGRWISLGTHELTTTPVVRLADRTGEAASLGRRIAFDAVRFTPADAPVDPSRSGP